MIKLFFVLCLLFCPIFISPVQGQSSDESKKLFSFAESLYQTKDYYRAITEYKRFLHYYPEHPLRDSARLKIGYAYKEGGKFELALKHFRKIGGREADLQVAETLYTENNFPLALREYKKFVLDYPTDKLKGYAEYKIGWTYIQMEKYRLSVDNFRKLAQSDPQFKSASDLAAEVDKISNLPQKSPTIAGAMSAIIPGSGQIYSQRTADGITSFILNGLFIWGTIESINNGNHVTAAILALFETGWYSGGIYNAVNDAYKYNRAVKEEHLKKIRQNYRVSVNFDPETREPSIEFEVQY